MGNDDPEAKKLRQQLASLREAHEAVIAAKCSDIKAVMDELALVNADITAVGPEERKWKRRLHCARGTVMTPQTSSTEASSKNAPSPVANEHHGKNLVKNIMGSLLEFNEALSKRR